VLFTKALESRESWLKKGLNLIEFNVANSLLERYLGFAYEKKGDLDTALNWYHKAIETCDRFEQYDHYYKGLAYLKIAEITYKKDNS